MIIKLIPQRSDETLVIVKKGMLLELNGEMVDLSPMQDGATLPRSAISSDWFAGDVEMVEGEVIVPLLLPNPWNYSHEQAFPEDIVNVPDGPVNLPKPLSVEQTALKFPVADKAGNEKLEGLEA